MLTLVICLSLFGLESPEPPSIGPSSEHPRSAEAFHREFLKITRRGIVLLEGMIEMDEKLLAEHSDIFTPQRASRMRKGLEEMRDEAEKMMKWEQELVHWEQKRTKEPGLKTDEEALARLDKLYWQLWPPTAPPPREKK